MNRYKLPAGTQMEESETGAVVFFSDHEKAIAEIKGRREQSDYEVIKKQAEEWLTRRDEYLTFGDLAMVRDLLTALTESERLAKENFDSWSFKCNEVVRYADMLSSCEQREKELKETLAQRQKVAASMEGIIAAELSTGCMSVIAGLESQLSAKDKEIAELKIRNENLDVMGSLKTKEITRLIKVNLDTKTEIERGEDCAQQIMRNEESAQAELTSAKQEIERLKEQFDAFVDTAQRDVAIRKEELTALRAEAREMAEYIAPDRLGIRPADVLQTARRILSNKETE